jgi:hypothetical protein
MPVSRKMTHFNMTPDLMRFRGGNTKAKWIDANKKSATPCCCLTDRTEGKWGIVSICDEFLVVVPVRQVNCLPLDAVSHESWGVVVRFPANSI